MITPAYSPTATERVLPRLALDFTTGVLDSRVTVTRALNTATRVNSSGYIEIVNANLPRFDYSPTTLAPKGLLIEEMRANIFTYSEDFSNAAWQRANLNLTPNVINAPTNTQVGSFFVPTAISNVHVLYRNSITITAGTTYTLSIFAKKGAYAYIGLGLHNGAVTAGNEALRVFNLNNGTLGGAYNTTPTNSTIEDFGNGWYRCSITWTISTTSMNPAFFVLPSDQNPRTSFTGDGTSGLYMFGGGCEAGAFATSYIPTTTTSLTRNADAVSMTGTNFSDWYNATSGAILARSRQSVITGTRPSIYISDGTANNIISLRGLSANPELYIKATTDQTQIDAGTLTANSSFGLVGAWTTDNCAAAINGGAAVTDTSATIPTVDRMLIGSDGTNYLNGQVERISYWPQRITNAEAQAFSK